MKFAMLICCAEDEWDTLDPEIGIQEMEHIMAWVGKWQERGKIAEVGEELDSPKRSKTIRQQDGAPVVSDGPYLQLKEVVGGIIVLETEDIDEAAAIASQWPTLHRNSIEIRPILEH
jgi:hypothetical protein